MNSVTLNGTSYNDGDTGPNNLGAGGHRTVLLPMLADAVVDLSAKVTAAANQVEAAQAAANSAAVAANVTLWVSGKTYGIGENTYSTVPGKPYIYRRTTIGSGTQDPSVDSANWMMAPGQTPLQTGNAGKYRYTNGTNESWEPIPGLAGAVITGAVALTATSPAAMTITPASAGLYATLPVATTCIEAASLFSFYNAGDFDYGIKNSAGVQLGWVRPKSGAVIGLADNLSAAGVWTLYGVEKTGVTAKLLLPAVAGVNLGNLIAVPLDATRVCFIFGGANCYAIVYDSSSLSWGAPTLVRVVDQGLFSAVLSAANQVLVVSCSATALEAVTLTISGTGITVNTGSKGAATLSTSMSSASPTLVAVGASFVVGYMRTPGTNDAGVRAISISGITPTIGAESTLLVGNVPIVFASGSIARCVSWSATQVRCSPFTVSGSTLTLGTAATVTATASMYRAILNGNGNIVVDYPNTTHFASIFKLSGTVEAVNSADLGQIPSGINQTTALPVTAAKLVYCTVASSSIFLNTLTDSAGTASVGTEVQVSNIGTLSNIGASAVLSGIAAFLVHGTGTAVHKVDVNFAGTSPALLSTSAVAGSLLTGFANTTSRGGRHSFALVTAAGITSLAFDAAAQSIVATSAALYQVKAPPMLQSNYVGIAGVASNESYFQTGSTAGTSPVTFQRIEAAA